jgi:hypothetical protein
MDEDEAGRFMGQKAKWTIGWLASHCAEGYPEFVFNEADTKSTFAHLAEMPDGKVENVEVLVPTGETEH